MQFTNCALLHVVAWLRVGTACDNQGGSERYRIVPANADGIGKAYMGRQIAHVMGFQGAAWLEREEREREERSDLLLQILAPAPGM